MSPELNREYPAEEDIRDVLQVISLLLESPALPKKGGGTIRATVVSYADLQRIKKRLTHALTMIEKGQLEMGAELLQAKQRNDGLGIGPDDDRNRSL